MLNMGVGEGPSEHLPEGSPAPESAPVSGVWAGGAGVARVALDVPIADWFDYALSPEQRAQVVPGSWVVVPWGRVRRVGVVVDLSPDSDIAPDKLRAVSQVLADAPAPDPHWLAVSRFAARYYHRPLGEVVLPAIPKLLRTPASPRARVSVFARSRLKAPRPGTQAASLPPPPTDAQRSALDTLCASTGFGVWLLHGVTGSGKTEVYLQWLAHLLAQRPDSQVLMLVPEIGLTPQLARHLEARFAGLRIAVLHSDLPDGERAAHWLAAADGLAQVVVGTRLSILAPLPRLAGIVVDEEHDASYKQQEGVRYSARDLAIALARQRDIPVVLGSATPSLESWHAAQRGRYRLLRLPQRAAGGATPALRVVDVRGKTLTHGLTPAAIEAIGAAIARGEQALVFLNRRGFAPVLNCEACGWISGCDTCSAYRVLHRSGARPLAARAAGASGGRGDEARAAGAAAGPAAARPMRYRLVCHHCGADQPVPRHCPTCGNVDLTPLGRGTQRIEDGLAELFPQRRIGRLDRDVARRRGAAETLLAAAHAGDLDILVGTQMLAKGHDFARLSVVVVVDADSGLYAADFRAPERLFAVLMQVAGRAGRSAGTGAVAEVVVQTRFPQHPLFGALARHDFDGFADEQLREREQAGLPPFVHQALLRAEAPALAEAIDWLAQARRAAEDLAPHPAVALYDPVPLAMMRVAGTERAQLLVESASRKALHAFVGPWLERLRATRTAVRWQLEIDPLEI
jgi:primosomal protein N' (replication factor Y)